MLVVLLYFKNSYNKLNNNMDNYNNTIQSDKINKTI